VIRGRGPAIAVLFCVAVAACQKPVKPGDPVRGLTKDQRASFDLGEVVFDSTFTPGTGLGPLFNADGCGECHEDPVKGGVGDEVELHASAFHSPLCDPLAAEGGFVFQLKSTPALKAALGIDSEPVPPNAARALRTTPVLFGRGLLDLVPDSVLLSYADPDDRNRDGISGRPHHFVDGRPGRFGRKVLPQAQDVALGVLEVGMGSIRQPRA